MSGSWDRALRARLAAAGQDALAEYVDALPADPQETLAHQLAGLDLELVARLLDGEGLAAPAPGSLAPVPFVPAADRPDPACAERGRDALRRGTVAFALLAGGQASRLQWDGPKGTFPIGPKTERTLFQVLVEHVRRAERDHGALPPLAVTTSATTDAAIRAYFETHDCLGFPRDRLAFACQASLPALDDDGRFLLAAPDRVFTSPDGHGGALTALESTGVLAAWEEQGIATVCTYQIDNPLLDVVDPDFLGRLGDGEAPIATKIVAKRAPEEKVGVVARVGGRPALVEYSEITPEQAAARDPDGGLTYRLGSIAVHAFDLAFLRRELQADLPLHTARKEIPCVDEAGAATRRPGRKFERFLFDLFPRADDVTVVEVEREREYAPVKNKEGADSPATARAALDAMYRRWYAEAGVAPPDDGPLELSPLDALGPDDLAAR